MQLSFGYQGQVYPVNPQENQVLGLKAYSRVGDIPGPVDFATITVPAPSVPKVVEECLAKGVKAAQILTAGFRETGEEGRRLEEKVTEIAARGIRIIGPNCFGVYAPAGGLTILPGEDFPRESGPVAFISQSGGLAVRVPRRAGGWGIRFSKVISYGNACDVNECDLIEYRWQDPETRVSTGYIEGIKNGSRFFKLLREVTRDKPVILWKGGLTRGGARAVHSHTGSLGGEEAAWNAFFRQSGVIRANSLEELLDTTLAFRHLMPHAGRRVSVVGGGGAIGVAAADGCERVGLSVPLFSARLQKKLASILPAVGTSFRNPVDIASPFPPPPVLKAVLEAIISEGGIETIIIAELEFSGASASMKDVGERYGNTLGEAAQVPVDIKKRLGIPIAMVLPVEAIGADAIEFEGARRRIRDHFLKEGIPVFLTLERAAKALSNFIGYHELRDSISSPDLNKSRLKELV